MSFKIEWKKSGVLAVFQGNTSMADIDQVGEVIYSDSRFKNCLYQLIDFTLADLSQIELNEVHELSKNDSSVSLEFPNVALVIVAHQALAKALVFHYRMLVKAQNMKWEIKLYNNTEEALEWCHSLS